VTMPIQVLLVDDHSVVRQGLRMFLALDPELAVVGEAANGREAQEMIAACQHVYNHYRPIVRWDI
jgi:DNA-binding NarL/FixJ family response regulator